MSLFTIPNAVLIALAQVAVIVFGVLFTNKAYQISEQESTLMGTLVRECGFLLLLAPLFWIALAANVRRSVRISDDVKVLTFWSGAALVVCFVILFVRAFVKTAFTPVDFLGPEI